MTPVSWRSPMNSKRSRRRSGMRARRSRPQHRGWCRRRSRRTTTASAAVIDGPRRVGRPRRRPRIKRSPRRWHGSTMLGPQHAWPRAAPTRQGGPSKPCSARPGTAHRNELRASTARGRRPAAKCGWVEARPGARGTVPSPGPRGACARRRPVERRRADGPGGSARFALRAAKDRGRPDRAARPRRVSARHIVVLHGATSAGARAPGVAAGARRAPRSVGARRCRRRRATRAFS
jgi:hypothetical protein